MDFFDKNNPETETDSQFVEADASEDGAAILCKDIVITCHARGVSNTQRNVK